MAEAKVGLSISLNDRAADERSAPFARTRELPVTDIDGKFRIVGILRNSRSSRSTSTNPVTLRCLVERGSPKARRYRSGAQAASPAVPRGLENCPAALAG